MRDTRRKLNVKKLKNYKPSFNSSLWIGLALVFLYLPLLVMAIFSFNDSKSLSNWSGFSLRWYQELFANQRFWGQLQQLEFQNQNRYCEKYYYKLIIYQL